LHTFSAAPFVDMNNNMPIYKLTPVLVLAGLRGGEDKSVLLKPLYSVFSLPGQVFPRPEKSSFPLMGIENSKVIFLDEFRFNPRILSYGTQCLLFDGSAVPEARPQNVQGTSGHSRYRGSARIFVTSKLADLERLEKLCYVSPETGEPLNAEASMIYRRLKVYKFKTRVPKPMTKFNYSGRCFAHYLRQHYSP
jgi:hypothetical protein